MDDNYFLNCWFAYARDLIIELYNTFIYGNFLSSTAMTRSLIEYYVYLNIIVEDKEASLLEKWYFCSIINNSKNMSNEYKEKTKMILKEWCESLKKEYEISEAKFGSGNENKWLKSKINRKRITFKDVCEYTKIPNLYDDFKSMSSFVHAQDVTSKMMPFTFYESIISKFYKMMFYIFRVIEFFQNNKLIIEELKKLEKDLDYLVSLY